MKKLLVLAIILAALGSQSCLKNYGTIKVPMTFEQFFDINLATGTATFTEMKLVDLTNDSVLIEYESNIKEYTVKSVDLYVTAYSGPQSSSFSGDIAYSATTNNTPIPLASAANFKFYDLFSTSSAYSATILESAQSNFSDLILSDKSFFAYLDGTVTETPLTATIKLVVEIEVLANILE